MTQAPLLMNPWQPEPLLIVISGPSGVGKDTIIRRLKLRSDNLQFVITATTRPPRPDERHGQDYFFVSAEEFERMIREGELLEHALVYGDHKGIPKAQARAAFASGKDVVLRVDVQGAATIRKLYPEALLIFLTTESTEALIRRLKLRKTESEKELERRLDTVRRELEALSTFDYLVVNRDNQIDETVNSIMAIIRAEHQRIPHRKVEL